MKRIKKIIPFLILLICFTVTTNSNLIASNTLTDKEITNAVDQELLYNATTPSYLIDIETNEGIVTLSGSVDNVLARDRAVKIAQTVKGVRAVVDKIEVNAPYRIDVLLQKDVNDALLNDPATDSYEINVTATDGVVTLDGTVESWQEKQLAEYVAKGVRGVKDVTNNIDINYTANISDYEITKNIEQTLKNDIRIDDALIHVKVKNGKVHLYGTAGSANEKALATSRAWTTGVKSVDNDKLEVKEWARDEKLRKNKYVLKSDQEIQNAVKDAFFYDPRVFSFNPSVSVNNGTVTLMGVVDNLKAKKAAEQDAKNVVGVIRVKNYLKVRPVFIPEDNDLENDVETALQKSPVIEKWELDVTANHGIVYLNGTVDSYFEKIQAENLASKTKGVIAVENNLTVYDNNDYYFSDYYGWNSYYPPYLVDVHYNTETDNEIERKIENELWWSPYVNQDEVDVTVDNGTAILEGTVDTRREKLFAEINALEGGAVDVENNLEVNYLK